MAHLSLLAVACAAQVIERMRTDPAIVFMGSARVFHNPRGNSTLAAPRRREWPSRNVGELSDKTAQTDFPAYRDEANFMPGRWASELSGSFTRPQEAGPRLSEARSRHSPARFGVPHISQATRAPQVRSIGAPRLRFQSPEHRGGGHRAMRRECSSPCRKRLSRVQNGRWEFVPA